MKRRHMNSSLATLGTSEGALVVPRLPNVCLTLTRLPTNNKCTHAGIEPGIEA